MSEITLGVVVVVLLISISIYTEIKTSDLKNQQRSKSLTALVPPPARRPPVNVLVSIDEMVYVEIDGKAIYGKVVGINHDGVVISYGKDKPITKIFNNSQIYKTKE